MIKVKVNKEKNSIKNITISGHSMYNYCGKDIVCSSVSSMVILTINLINKLDIKAINYENNKDGIIINVDKESNVVNIILNNLIDMLKELSEDYNKYIKFI